jgi:ATP-dependent exoDNAse (exonuclease V) beta subunit
VSETDRIFDPRRPAIVVASAGSGKTWRLVRRYLKLVATIDPETGRAWAEPEEVVAVTFTRAAAAEMRERVFSALATPHDAVDDDDIVVAEVLATHDASERAELAGRLAGAPVGTLHSLCARLLRRFPELCGVPPDARPIDPGEHRVRLERFVRREIDAALDDPEHPHHDRCRRLLSDRPLEGLRKDLQALVDDEHEIPYAWTDPATLHSVRLQFLWQQAHAVARALEQPCDSVLRGIPRTREAWSASKAKEADKARISLDQTEEICRRIIGAAQRTPGQPDAPTPSTGGGLDAPVDLAELSALLRALGSIDGLSHAKRLKETRGPILELKRVNHIEGKIRSRWALKSVLDLDLADDSHEHAMARWIELGVDLRQRYADELRRDGLLRYGDLERLALELLEDPKARAWLEGSFRHILVDEFQDTSELQIRIVHALAAACGDAIPCFVGDPKQSIYRFRGAEVEGFMREVEAARARGDVRSLPESRRPSPSLTRFFDRFFPPLFTGTPQLGPESLEPVDDGAEVPWDGPMTTSREHDRLPGAPVELLLRTWADHSLPEPERLALHVRRLVDGRDEPRPDGKDGDASRVRYRDIAILVPRWRIAEQIRATLEDHGIPSEVTGGRGLLPLPEVRDLGAYVRYWARADDELAAVSIARGPTFAISDLGLYALTRWPGVLRRANDGTDHEGGVWVAWGKDPATPGPRRFPRSLRAVLQRGRLDPEAALAAMTAAGVVDPSRHEELLDRLRDDARALETNRDRFATLCADAGVRLTADLLTDAITDFAMEAAWLASPRGRRAIANAWKFVEIVRGLEPGGPDPRGVADWLDSGSEPAPEGLISGTVDAVTITSFHGAKGREWPVVYVAGLGDPVRGWGRPWDSTAVPVLGPSSATERIRLPRLQRPHRGFVVEADPLTEVASIASAPLEAAEQKRLLYVACTRARDKLVLSGDLRKSAHIGIEDRPQLVPGYHYRNEKAKQRWALLEFQPRPLYLCRTIADYVVSGLDASYSRDARPLLPSERSGLADLVSAVSDESLLERSADSPPDPSRISVHVEADPVTLARGRGTSIDTLNPSMHRSPWSTVDCDWRLPLPDASPVMPSEAVMDALDPRQLGELFHRAMERWGFRGDLPSPEACRSLAGAWPEHAEALGSWVHGRVEALARTDLATELHAAATARRVFHEVPVDAVVDGHRVRGQIDLLWQDASGLWCVLDYKVTRRVQTADALHDLANEYGGQLMMYRQALGRWRPQGRMPFFGRFGLWLAPSARAMWLEL